MIRGPIGTRKLKKVITLHLWSSELLIDNYFIYVWDMVRVSVGFAKGRICLGIIVVRSEPGEVG